MKSVFRSFGKDQPEKPKKREGAKAMKNVNIYHREWTAEEIARGEHRQAVGGMWDEIGLLQFEFLKSRGLQPNHKLMDVGCGALRGGIHFVRYLDAGNYFGVDVNASLIEAGRHELALAGLEKKNAHLLVNDQFDMTGFSEPFDYLLAVSVFTHLFANHIVRCLVEARKVLAPDGRFFATFFEAPHAAHLAPITQGGGITSCYDHDPMHYSVEEFQFMARIAGLKAEAIGDWNHPRNQRMIVFTPA